MALYLSESGIGGSSSGGGGGMYTVFNTSNRFNFHALRRDETGMLYYTKSNTSDTDVIDVFNTDGSSQTDFMDAWSNVVEVGAVKSVSLISGGLPIDTDANVTYTVTDLVGNGDGEGEPNQKPGTGLNLLITRNSTGLINDIQIHSGGESFSPNETVSIASSKINDVTDLTIRIIDVVKSYSNNENIDKYQQYKFEARKITYFIDDEGYFVARFGTYDHAGAGPK